MSSADPPMAWLEHANCRGLDPGLFIPDGPGRTSDAAKAVCRDCVVRGDCLAHAIDNDEWLGVWGGTSPDERRLIVGRRPHGSSLRRRWQAQQRARAAS